jgi:hypothetical protein
MSRQVQNVFVHMPSSKLELSSGCEKATNGELDVTKVFLHLNNILVPLSFSHVIFAKSA